MKRTLGVIIAIGVLVAWSYLTIYGTSTTSVTNPVATTTSATPEVKPTPSEMMETATQEMITEAISASSSEIAQARQTAADKVGDEMRMKIERRVRLELSTQNEASIKGLEKSLSFQ